MLEGLTELRQSERTSLNKFGFPPDYMPFCGAGTDATSFDSIRTHVMGDVDPSAPPADWQGYFAFARTAEGDAVYARDEFVHRKDIIRQELFTINEQAETRLARICGRVDEVGEPGDAGDPIDYELEVAYENPACEIGQAAQHIEMARLKLNQSIADMDQFLEDIELQDQYLQDAVYQHKQKAQVIQEYADLQKEQDRHLQKINAAMNFSNAMAAFKPGTGELGVGIAFTNAVVQGVGGAGADEIQMAKNDLATEERIALAGIDTELFKLKETKTLEQMMNNTMVMAISTEIEAKQLSIGYGQLAGLLAERDELIGQRGRRVANLGEMSYADPSFRLLQFGKMKEAEVELDHLKRWIYLMTRSLYYKWALAEDRSLENIVPGIGPVNINMLQELQVVGVQIPGEPYLDDVLTASDCIRVLIDFDAQAEVFLGLAPAIFRYESHTTNRYSLREDFLHINLASLDPQEQERAATDFRTWLTDPEKIDPVSGDLVLEFDTTGNLEGYEPADGLNLERTWTNFALRTSFDLPLWNHKIDNVGVAIRSTDPDLTATLVGYLRYGGSGYLKRNTSNLADLLVYSLDQWIKTEGLDAWELTEYRTLILDIPKWEDFGPVYLNAGLDERPIFGTRWQLVIPSSQLGYLDLNRVEDILICIESTAYQAQ